MTVIMSCCTFASQPSLESSTLLANKRPMLSLIAHYINHKSRLTRMPIIWTLSVLWCFNPAFHGRKLEKLINFIPKEFHFTTHYIWFQISCSAMGMNLLLCDSSCNLIRSIEIYSFCNETAISLSENLIE